MKEVDAGDQSIISHFIFDKSCIRERDIVAAERLPNAQHCVHDLFLHMPDCLTHVLLNPF
jgi:hypothetical protein